MGWEVVRALILGGGGLESSGRSLSNSGLMLWLWML